MTQSVLASYINGAYRPGAGAARFANLNPATGALLCEVEVALEPEVALAIESAQAGLLVWSAMSGAERGRILLRAAQILRSRNRELAELEVRDNGKPIQEAEVVDVASGADCIEYFAGLAASVHGHHYGLKNAFAYTVREPLGICVGIGAWNYPLQIACWKSAPALACGNAMIFKPSELSPLTAAKLAEIYTEAGVPDGVFNVLQGDARTGRLLVAHPDVAKVSLTGAVDTGKAIMAAAAGTLKRVTMELGGKSAMLVFADADLEQAVSAAMLGNFYTQGEICTNCTRVFVHGDIYDAFLARLVERTAKLRVGDPMRPDTQVGALISAGHTERVLGYIASGVEQGARLLIGGKRAAGEGTGGGNFVEPTIFADCGDDMTIVREEIFGPVMSVLRFEGEDEAVQRANGTRFGLAAGVFTRDLARGHRVAGRLKAGVCWINNYNITPVEMPFGGIRESGIGHENSLVTIDHYTQLRSVYVELGEVACPYE
ncbi:betaine-aldehyde dehydrogenase [Janthinobacterium sp. CG_23.3]|uniref:betaine-aldehyde dehydrogenase n=1 Tax=unclassified Janthinobacterium TaxID=2610881 RepID=UPI00034C8107|nr:MULTISPECIES: betaine-aldehyde dehydrogenase [unclassified Janthinobacterium]MEC5162040.1 betaine-aldehyde dehydrogenase [Janthinobacterium sp. CG_S6]